MVFVWFETRVVIIVYSDVRAFQITRVGLGGPIYEHGRRQS